MAVSFTSATFSSAAFGVSADAELFKLKERKIADIKQIHFDREALINSSFHEKGFYRAHAAITLMGSRF